MYFGKRTSAMLLAQKRFDFQAYLCNLEHVDNDYRQLLE